jgi:hypothetical protein
MKEKNPFAVEMGKLSVKGKTKKELRERIKNATKVSQERRKKYGFGYWKDPKIMQKIQLEENK